MSRQKHDNFNSNDGLHKNPNVSKRRVFYMFIEIEQLKSIKLFSKQIKLLFSKACSRSDVVRDEF